MPGFDSRRPLRLFWFLALGICALCTYISLVFLFPETFSSDGVAVRVALLCLVLGLLIIPLVWVIAFNRRAFSFSEKPASGENGQTELERFLEWLTGMSVPWMVLGLAMVLRGKELVETNGESAASSIAGIMILYALSLLASFIYVDLQRIKRDFRSEMESASDWYRAAAPLGQSPGGVLLPQDSVLELVEAWATWYQRFGIDPASRTSGRLRSLLGASYLSTYAREERRDILGGLDVESIPENVCPLIDGKVPDGVSFTATNVGFYAKFLERSLGAINLNIKGEEQEVCIGVVTSVLPQMWWNWPVSRGPKRARVYNAIRNYRAALERTARDSGGARIHRIILVQGAAPNRSLDDPGESVNAKFFEGLFSENDWRETRHNRILFDSEENMAYATSRLATSSNPQEYVDQWVRWLCDDRPRRSPDHEAYPVFLSSLPHPLEKEIRTQYKRELRPVVEVYNDTMHPRGRGCSSIRAIDADAFLRRFFQKDCAGLNGCTDIMFIGTRNIDGRRMCLWEQHQGMAPEHQPEWAMVLLTTMSPASETMFLTLVSNEELMGDIWGCVSAACAGTKMVDQLWDCTQAAGR